MKGAVSMNYTSRSCPTAIQRLAISTGGGVLAGANPALTPMTNVPVAANVTKIGFRYRRKAPRNHADIRDTVLPNVAS